MRHRVLIVDFTSSFGGAFEHALALSQYLAGRPNTSVGLVSAQDEGLVGKRLPSNADSFSIPPYQKLTVEGLAGRAGNALSAAKDILLGEIPRALRLNRIFSRFQPTVVHLNNLINIQQSAVAVCYFRNVPSVFCHQDFEYRSRLALRALPYVKKHIAISQAMKQHLLELGVPSEKIEVIHHGVDTARFSPEAGTVDLHAMYGIPSDHLLFALFGRLVDWKGPELFLRAAALVVQGNPKAHAILVGDTSDGDPGFAKQLNELSASLGISDRVTFAGYTPDTARYMNSVDLVVHCSTRPEPFGLVVTEAMACERPVIAMAEGGPLDIVLDGETGRLVPPRNAEALASVIADALRSRDQLRRWGVAGRQRVLEHFSLERCGSQYEALYRSVAPFPNFP